MEPRKYALADLFEGQLVYVVPNYQRLYVWNREDQWEPLWSDVSEIANRLFQDAEARSSENVNPDSAEPHFLGAVVLKMSGSTPDLARQWRVIDGQQRLTTLQLLLAAAVTELESAGLVPSANRLRQLTANFSDSGPSGFRSLKINHHRHERGHDYERFSDVMTAALIGETTAHLDGPMARCFAYFQAAVRLWLSERDGHINTAASALATTLIMKLHVVGIYLDPHEKEHIIFETLNARGEPLTEWDKIKNYLLYKADADPALEQEKFFERFLDRFDVQWWRQGVGRGVQRPRTDVFADYWLESKKKTSVAVRRVFREFQNHVDDEDQQLEALTQELVSDAEYFRQFEQPDIQKDNREVLFHRRRLDMAIGAIWPLIFHLRGIDVDQAEREGWFALLEGYFVRRLITGYQARSYDRVALELLNVLPTSNCTESARGDVIRSHLLAYSEAATLWPTDSEVRNAVLNRRLSGYAQRLVLTAIERWLASNRAAIPQPSPGVQVEHIMPQGWQTDSWPLPDSVEPTSALEKRTQAIHTLGNLTLLNGRLNAAVSNAPWVTKRKEIQKSDNLFLNRRLLEKASDSWMESDIRLRGEWMASAIIDTWPRG